MTFKAKLVVVSMLPLALAGLAVFVSLIQQRFLTVYPTPETESAFLKHYTPELAVNKFRLKNNSFGWQSSMSAGAGREFATHSGNFEGDVAIDPKCWMRLMSSIREDLSIQLSRDGARILTQRGDALDGFHFDYKLGNSLGSVVVSPLRIVSIPRGCACKAVVHVYVSIEERYFRKQPGLITVRLTSAHTP
jgi:hypothetical protein